MEDSDATVGGAGVDRFTPPRKVFVLGRTYKIVVQPGMAEDDGCAGKVVHDDRKIFLDPTCDMSSALRHEIVHCYEDALGYDLDEHIVEQIAACWQEFGVRQPTLEARLTKNARDQMEEGGDP